MDGTLKYSRIAMNRMKPNVTMKSVLRSEKNGPLAASAGVALNAMTAATVVSLRMCLSPFICASTAFATSASSAEPPSAGHQFSRWSRWPRL